MHQMILFKKYYRQQRTEYGQRCTAPPDTAQLNWCPIAIWSCERRSKQILILWGKGDSQRSERTMKERTNDGSSTNTREVIKFSYLRGDWTLSWKDMKDPTKSLTMMIRAAHFISFAGTMWNLSISEMYDHISERN